MFQGQPTCQVEIPKVRPFQEGLSGWLWLAHALSPWLTFPNLFVYFCVILTEAENWITWWRQKQQITTKDKSKCHSTNFSEPSVPYLTWRSYLPKTFHKVLVCSNSTEPWFPFWFLFQSVIHINTSPLRVRVTLFVCIAEHGEMFRWCRLLKNSLNWEKKTTKEKMLSQNCGVKSTKVSRTIADHCREKNRWLEFGTHIRWPFGDQAGWTVYQIRLKGRFSFE